MNSPAPLRPVALLLALALAPLAAAGGSAAPDVFLVTVESARADRLGCYGAADSPTPRLDALAAEGTLFERAYAHAPWTLPAAASLMTGLTPLGHGVHEDGVVALAPGLPTLAERMLAGGYRTAAFIGSLELSAPFGLARGFELFDDQMGAPQDLKELVRDRRSRFTVGACLEWLEVEDERPAFAWVDLADARYPYAPPVDLVGKSEPYTGELVALDRELGRLLDALAARGREALVVVVGATGEALGDHGESTHGLTLQEAAVRVPLVFARVGAEPSARRVATPVGQCDVAPTVLELAGLPALEQPAKRAPFAGRSLAARVAGEVPQLAQRDVYLESEVGARRFGWSTLRGLVRGADKLVLGATPSLYDVLADPGEEDDRAASNPERVAELRGALDALLAAAAELGARGAPVRDGIVARLAEPTYAPLVCAVDGALPEASGLDPRAQVPAWERYQEALLAGWSGSPHLMLEPLEEAAAASPQTAALHLLAGIAYERARRFEDAAQEHQKALELDPGSAMAHYYLGRALISMRQPAEAELHYMLAVELDPGGFHPRHALARRMIEEQRYEEALPHYLVIVTMRPDEQMHWMNLVQLERMLGDWPGLSQALAEAVERFPDDLFLRNYRAWLLATAPEEELRDPEAALRIAERLVEETAAQDPGVLDTYAAALAAAGRFDDAKREVSRAILLADRRRLGKLVEDMRARLALYQKGEPFRDA